MLQKSCDKLANDKHEVLLEVQSERKKSKLINNQLNPNSSDLRVKHQKEKTLGNERKEKIKLEKQLEMLQKKVEEKQNTSTRACQTDQHPDIRYQTLCHLYSTQFN